MLCRGPTDLGTRAQAQAQGGGQLIEEERHAVVDLRITAGRHRAVPDLRAAPHDEFRTVDENELMQHMAPGDWCRGPSGKDVLNCRSLPHECAVAARSRFSMVPRIT